MKLLSRFFRYWPQDFPAISVFTGRNFPAVSVVFGRDFPAVAFLAWEFKKTLWAAGKFFWYQQRDFLSLTQEFSGGKLKQKGFFHSVNLTVQLLSHVHWSNKFIVAK
jgi:hypothetical protein